jgi:hypothetical protein
MTMAAENRSERVPTASPAACSGDMYRHLPMMRREAAGGLGRSTAAWAMPKSAIFTSPARDSRMFEGDTSRWTTPR